MPFAFILYALVSLGCASDANNIEDALRATRTKPPVTERT